MDNCKGTLQNATCISYRPSYFILSTVQNTKMPSRTIKMLVIFVIVISFTSLSQSWRRRHRGRRPAVNCRVDSWSPWSPCSAVQSGTQHRTRSMIRYPSCGGAGCQQLRESRRCLCGATAANCQYSAWSKWSECSECGEFQTSTRYIITREQCGGTPCNMTALNKTPVCQTQCLDKETLVDVQCHCRPGAYGSCCLLR